ncbi:LOW QUALITY PROTEIN: protein amnionless [Mantella aurantiaca]
MEAVAVYLFGCLFNGGFILVSLQKVSVFVRSAHSLKSLYLPLDGEFILSPGSGFMAASAEDPTCGEGSLVNFGDVDGRHWLDPTLWCSAASIDDLENGRFLFAVDTERVPCHHDDVIFPSETSFRVRVQEAASETWLRSLSVLGRKFSSNAEFGEFLASRTGRLQFPDPAQPQVTDTNARTRSGCLCGNEKMQQEICWALLQHSGNKCPEVPCANPFQLGHCCPVCGSVISLNYTSRFDMETYRSRLIHSFLSLDKYSEVKLAISKVRPSAPAMGGKSLGSEPKIQIVCIAEKTSAGGSALQLGRDIMADIESHGESFGISQADLEDSSGDVSSGVQNGSVSAGGVAGIILTAVLLVSLLGLAYFLYRKDVFRFFWLWRNTSRLEESGEVEGGGFSNPVFDVMAESEEAKPGLDIGCEEWSAPSAVRFANPLFDRNVEA